MQPDLCVSYNSSMVSIYFLATIQFLLNHSLTLFSIPHFLSFSIPYWWYTPLFTIFVDFTAFVISASSPDFGVQLFILYFLILFFLGGGISFLSAQPFSLCNPSRVPRDHFFPNGGPYVMLSTLRILFVKSVTLVTSGTYCYKRFSCIHSRK